MWHANTSTTTNKIPISLKAKFPVQPFTIFTDLLYRIFTTKLEEPSFSRIHKNRRIGNF